jgi:hypothetical protein
VLKSKGLSYLALYKDHLRRLYWVFAIGSRRLSEVAVVGSTDVNNRGAVGFVPANLRLLKNASRFQLTRSHSISAVAVMLWSDRIPC